MQVTRDATGSSPFRPLCRVLPVRLAGLSIALLKATALELAILAGHLLLYPSGILPERRHPTALSPLESQHLDTTAPANTTDPANTPTTPTTVDSPDSANSADSADSADSANSLDDPD